MNEEILAEIAREAGADLDQLWRHHRQLKLLEANIAKYAVAANMAASKAAPAKNFIAVNPDETWHRSVELMDNVFLCHRPMVTGAEFAVIRQLPDQNAYEICQRAWNVVTALTAFVCAEQKTQRFLAETTADKLKAIYRQKYPDPAAASPDRMVQQFVLDPSTVPLNSKRERL